MAEIKLMRMEICRTPVDTLSPANAILFNKTLNIDADIGLVSLDPR